MLINAAVLAILMGTSLILLFSKFPKKIKGFCLRHPLAMDAIVTFAVVGSFGTTATVLLAAAMVDVILGVAVYVGSHRDDFQYIFDALDYMKSKLKEIQGYLLKLGQEYRERNVLSEVSQTPVSGGTQPVVREVN